MAKLVNQSLKSLSYYQTGGTCAFLFAPESLEELAQNIKEISAKKLPYFILGGGSNSLLMDEKWDGAVVSLHKLTFVKKAGDALICGAGKEISELVRYAHEQGLTGLSWMYRLPGQVGGATRMNARCYGGEISQVVSKISAVTNTGEIKIFTCEPGKKDVFKGYKNTVFMDHDLIVGEVELKLQVGDKKEILDKMLFCENDREKKGQFLYPSCGCVFKNDYSPKVSVSSGLLLEKAGAKELKKGGAVVSSFHANFVYNQSATSRDILELTLHMRSKVWETFGVWLEYEMELLGEVPKDLQERFLEKKSPAYKEEKLEELRKIFHKPAEIKWG
jgi:UDP-N-acetylmuramate dehydrogenase